MQCRLGLEAELDVTYRSFGYQGASSCVNVNSHLHSVMIGSLDNEYLSLPSSIAPLNYRFPLLRADLKKIRTAFDQVTHVLVRHLDGSPGDLPGPLSVLF